MKEPIVIEQVGNGFVVRRELARDTAFNTEGWRVFNKLGETMNHQDNSLLTFIRAHFTEQTP